MLRRANFSRYEKSLFALRNDAYNCLILNEKSFVLYKTQDAHKVF